MKIIVSCTKIDYQIHYLVCLDDLHVLVIHLHRDSWTLIHALSSYFLVQFGSLYMLRFLGSWKEPIVCNAVPCYQIVTMRMANWKLYIVQNVFFLSCCQTYAYAIWPWVYTIIHVAPSDRVVIYCLVEFYSNILFYLVAITLNASILLLKFRCLVLFKRNIHIWDLIASANGLYLLQHINFDLWSQRQFICASILSISFFLFIFTYMNTGQVYSPIFWTF